MKFFYWLLIAIMSFGYFHGHSQTIIKDEHAQVRNVGNFSSVEARGGIDVYITQSNTTAVAVSASETKYANNIITELRNGVLVISYKNNGTDWGNRKLRAYVSAPNFNKIKAAGACDIKIDGSVIGKDLEIEVSGSSDFRGAVKVENLRLSASGSSDIVIEGTANNLKIDVSGSSDVKAYELRTDYADVHASGASDIQLTVNKELKAKASGSSDIHYKGDGLIRDMQVSGASDIKKKS
jgi:hypothetical protein